MIRQRRGEEPRAEPVYETGKVLFLKQVIPDSYRLDLLLEQKLPDSVPGQFMLLRPVDAPFLLPRPMSLFDREDREMGTVISFFFTVVGTGTRYLSQLRAGMELNVLGPLGRPFSLPDTQPALLVAGGRGIVPLHYLAKESRGSPARVKLLYGVGTAASLYPSPEHIPCEISIATDDGSAGRKGTVVDLLEQVLTEEYGNGQKPVVCSCGPDRMLASVASVAGEWGLSCQVCVEARMACGLGICRGCAVSLMSERGERSGYALACTDGPVFDARHIVWED